MTDPQRTKPNPDPPDLGGGLTLDDLRHLPPTIDVVTAGKALGVSRTKAYELARRGEFPCRVLMLGRSYRVPTAELLRLLGIGNEDSPPGTAAIASDNVNQPDPQSPLMALPTQGDSVQ